MKKYTQEEAMDFAEYVIDMMNPNAKSWIKKTPEEYANTMELIINDLMDISSSLRKKQHIH